jgi:hypothetical protein
MMDQVQRNRNTEQEEWLWKNDNEVTLQNYGPQNWMHTWPMVVTMSN